MILSILILSLSLVTGLPVEVPLMATIDDSEVHNREVRSLTYRLGWHLDRIDQRSPLLDGKYCPINQGTAIDHLRPYNIALVVYYTFKTV